jgi:valyl-tRNA synthetase
MKGYTTLHVPGFDHAGISTQSVVENMLLKTEGKGRHDYGRDAFLTKVWEWKDKWVIPLPHRVRSFHADIANIFRNSRYHSRTLSQIQRLGTSSDWDRAAFTLDPVSQSDISPFSLSGMTLISRFYIANGKGCQ